MLPRAKVQWVWEYKHATRWYVSMLAEGEPLLDYFDFVAKIDVDVTCAPPPPPRAQTWHTITSRNFEAHGLSHDHSSSSNTSPPPTMRSA